jgi:hypothetical protein
VDANEENELKENLLTCIDWCMRDQRRKNRLKKNICICACCAKALALNRDKQPSQVNWYYQFWIPGEQQKGC